MGILNRERESRCPHLGLAADPSCRESRASAEHRCYAGGSSERVDMDHQRRFCLASSYGRCPFLTATVTDVGTVERIEAWWRTVSPVRPALTAAQLGRAAELSAAAARRSVVSAAMLTLETWQNVRPQPAMPPVEVDESDPPIVTEEPAHGIVHVELPAAPQPNTARAWFERAKSAETLDDLIHCLERASSLEPQNALLSSNLERAVQRRELLRKAGKPKTTKPVEHFRRGPGPVLRALGAVVSLIRILAALTALALGSAWLLSALPAQLREPMVSASGVPTSWLPDPHGVTALVQLPHAGGYDFALAVPYTIGFMALFVGFGMLHRQQSPSGHR